MDVCPFLRNLLPAWKSQIPHPQPQILALTLKVRNGGRIRYPRRSLVQGLLGVAGSQLSSRNSLPLLQKGILTSASRILPAGELEELPENNSAHQGWGSFLLSSLHSCSGRGLGNGRGSRLRTACSGRWGDSSNFQLPAFFLCGRTFFGKGFSSSLHAWLTAPLLIYLLGIQFAFVKMSKGTRKNTEDQIHISSIQEAQDVRSSYGNRGYYTRQRKPCCMSLLTSLKALERYIASQTGLRMEFQRSCNALPFFPSCGNWGEMAEWFSQEYTASQSQDRGPFSWVTFMCLNTLKVAGTR